MGVKEIGQWVGTVTALPEDATLNLSIHKVVDKHQEPQNQGTTYPILPSEGTRHACGAHTYIQVKHSYTENINKSQKIVLYELKFFLFLPRYSSSFLSFILNISLPPTQKLCLLTLHFPDVGRSVQGSFLLRIYSPGSSP